MIIVLSLLFLAFVFGIWMGLGFYRRSTVKDTGRIPIVRRYAKSRSDVL
jgi:hypothetical protein